MYWKVEQDFEDAFPAVDLRFVDLSASYYSGQLEEALKQGKADVVEVDTVFLHDLVSKMLLEELPDSMLPPDTGLIYTYQYYGEGDTAPGYKQFDFVKHGSSGDPITLREYLYTTHTVNQGDPDESTIHPLWRYREFPSDTGLGSLTTEYAYTYHDGTNQIAQQTTTFEAVSVEKNGSGTPAVRRESFDLDGRPVWSKDERGTFSYREHDPVTGAMTLSIEDVKSGQGLSPPDGWGNLPAGGLHLVTDYEHDAEGRITQSLGPPHNIDGTTVRRAEWTVYDELDHQTRTASGYYNPSTQAHTLVNPVSIQQTDADGRSTESIQEALPAPTTPRPPSPTTPWAA